MCLQQLMQQLIAFSVTQLSYFCVLGLSLPPPLLTMVSPVLSHLQIVHLFLYFPSSLPNTTSSLMPKAVYITDPIIVPALNDTDTYEQCVCTHQVHQTGCRLQTLYCLSVASICALQMFDCSCFTVCGNGCLTHLSVPLAQLCCQCGIILASCSILTPAAHVWALCCGSVLGRSGRGDQHKTVV